MDKYDDIDDFVPTGKSGGGGGSAGAKEKPAKSPTSSPYTSKHVRVQEEKKAKSQEKK